MEEALSTAVTSLKRLIALLSTSMLMIQKLFTEFANSQLNTDKDSTRIFSLTSLVTVDTAITSLTNLNSLNLKCMKKFAKYKKLVLKSMIQSSLPQASLKTVLTRESERKP